MSETPDTSAETNAQDPWERFIERMAEAARAVQRAAYMQRRFRALFQQHPDPWALARSQERRDAAALARRAQELSETTGTPITAWDLRALARAMGDPVQGIRYGQHWTVLVPPHARHLITTTGEKR